MILGFDRFELNIGMFELCKNGQPVHLEPQVFALLCLLIENCDKAVSKEEIIETVWLGRSVYDATVSSRIKSLRHALGDDGQRQRIIKTVRGYGYRFVATVNEISSTRVMTRIEIARQNRSENDRDIGIGKPSIAVFPFGLSQNSGHFSTQADGLVHDLIWNLSKLSWLFVIARGSTFMFRGRDRDVGEIGREKLNIRYCLTGNVETSGSSIFVNVELLDARTQAVIWAERYSGTNGHIQEIRAQIASDVTVALELKIPLFEAEMARRSGTDALDAWSAFHLGLSHLYRLKKADNEIGIELLRKAVEMDPYFARAQAALSFGYWQSCNLGFDRSPEQHAKARSTAEKSFELDHQDAAAHLALARVNWLEHHFRDSLQYAKSAIRLNPNYAHGNFTAGRVSQLIEGAGMGKELLNMSLRLNPIGPLSIVTRSGLAAAYMEEEAFESAAVFAEDAALQAPQIRATLAFATVAHHLNGNHSRAAYWSKKLRTHSPSYVSTNYFHQLPFASRNLRSMFVETLAIYGF